MTENRLENRGGARPGSGRKPGSKNKNPKNTSKIEGKPSPEKSVNKAVEEANKKFTDGLSGDMKKLYVGFSKRQKLPLDDLRELAQSMKARYNIGLQSEIKQQESKIKAAKLEYKDVKKTKLVYGKTETEARVNSRLRILQEIINSKYHISSSLTTLSTELRNVFVEIERIEAGQPKGNVNIFNLLQGKGEDEKVDELEEKVFEDDPAVHDEGDK